ncbi:MAG TPA: ATP-binding protein [Bacteroidales bacterium]|nr:ATP-binding protein [Bacteroidales bacterium]HPS62105.1 ATP-binding protein [Bacteroidales bacterium]
MRSDNTRHITRLISEGEHQQLDFKFEIADASKIARTLVAFANTDGGRLLVGVKDNGALAGVRSEEEYYMVEAAAALYCKPPVGFQVKEWEIGKKTILEIIIPKSDSRPHYAKHKEGEWVAYHRVKDQNFPVNRILMRVWQLEDGPKGVYLTITDAERFLLDFLDAHESITLSKFCRLAGISRKKAENILVRFILLRLVSMHFNENLTFFTRGPGAGTPDNP